MTFMRTTMLAVVFGLAALPQRASAQELGSRALDSAPDLDAAVFGTIIGIAAVMVLATLGYLYRRERGLSWQFQQPDAVVEHHDAAHH